MAQRKAQTDEVAKRMGAALASVRAEQEMTQGEVAERYGISENGYAAYEQGRSKFLAADVPLLAGALRVPTAVLGRRLGLCIDETDDIANALVARFGPRIGQALVSLDRVLAFMEQGDTVALDVTIRRYVEHYETRATG